MYISVCWLVDWFIYIIYLFSGMYLYTNMQRLTTQTYAPCMEYLPTFTYIYPKNHPNVGKYTSTMEHMGTNIPKHLNLVWILSGLISLWWPWWPSHSPMHGDIVEVLRMWTLWTSQVGQPWTHDTQTYASSCAAKTTNSIVLWHRYKMV